MAEMKANTVEFHPVTHFILVHGFGSGGWCWEKIKPLMDKAGYKVSCPDLNSAGISTLDEYDEPLIRLLSSAPNTEKIVLVGHSAGGLSLTHMLHKFPKKIHLAVFIGATMLRNGFLSEQDVKDGLPSDYSKNESSSTPTPRRESTLEKAMCLCSPEDIKQAMLREKPGPLDVLANSKFKEDKVIDEVKRVYIKTKHDFILTPKQQEAMINKWPPNGVFGLDSDHNPNFSKPLELYDLLVKASMTY